MENLTRRLSSFLNTQPYFSSPIKHFSTILEADSPHLPIKTKAKRLRTTEGTAHENPMTQGNTHNFTGVVFTIGEGHGQHEQTCSNRTRAMRRSQASVRSHEESRELAGGGSSSWRKKR